MITFDDYLSVYALKLWVLTSCFVSPTFLACVARATSTAVYLLGAEFTQGSGSSTHVVGLRCGQLSI